MSANANDTEMQRLDATLLTGWKLVIIVMQLDRPTNTGWPLLINQINIVLRTVGLKIEILERIIQVVPIPKIPNSSL